MLQSALAYGKQRLRIACGVLALLCVFLYIPVSAQAATAAISQSYETASTDIGQGSLLSLASKRSAVVVPANSNNEPNLVGIAASKPLVELTNGNQHSIQVAVGGIAEALVSDVNGSVYAGDKIAASPISGIGMKATSANEIVGVAQTSLDSVKTVTKLFTGASGKQVSAKVGLLPISVSVNYYSAAAQGGTSAYIPPFLQNLANDIAGKAVSPLRVLIGAIAILFGFTTIVVMLYTGIRSGVISIGRNPLAADALRRGLVDILVTATGVLVVTGVIVAAVITA